MIPLTTEDDCDKLWEALWRNVEEIYGYKKNYYLQGII